MAETVPTPPAKRSRAQRWLGRLEESPHAFWLLFAATFVVALPIEAVLIPFMLIRPNRVWRIALVATLGVVTAGAVGYGIGHYLFETVGRWVIATMGWQESYRDFRAMFGAYGFWAIAGSGAVPVPFEVVVLVASAAGYSFPLFLLATIIARGVRYFGLALLVWAYGEQAVRLWRRHRLTAAALVAGIIVLAVAVPLWLGTVGG